MQMITVSEYLRTRLSELGIKDIIGVPGDYNLDFVEQIEHDDRFEWRGDCNELCASYAADGYAKIHGISAMVTTYGPGELSAINGIAGAYAENSSVIKIVGAFGLGKEKKQLPAHHTLLNNKYREFTKMYSHITIDQVELDFCNPGKQIDRAIKMCHYHKLPVYIRLPQDLINYEIPAPKSRLDLLLPRSDKRLLEDAWKQIQYKLNSDKPLIVIGEMTERYQVTEKLNKFLEQSGVPYMTIWSAKGAVREDLPNFMGTYAGVFSNQNINKIFDEAESVLCLGVKWWEINTGMYTVNLDSKRIIQADPEAISIDGKTIMAVTLNDVLAKLFTFNYKYQGSLPDLEIHNGIVKARLRKDEIEHNNIIYHIDNFLKHDDILVVDTGTVLMDSGEFTLPKGAKVINGAVWSSIGFAVPAANGVAMANKKGRAIVLVGDGAFQMTAQSLSTAFYHGLKPVILLINNDGYTIERGFVGMHSKYNDINAWKYLDLVKAFNGEAFTKTVVTDQELEIALQEINQNADKLCMIEIVMDKYKQPELLQRLTSLSEKV
ncbi:alpha-keto acid decarboxylase family protein [Francisella philomiragia]|uniref:Pyruvate decarboxylase n=1 Tax=Francisella philomiragia subsp. philomiragia (strain ATCC 25017 / CCUG 19701 / FSC 153 / O\|nr:thiamine pyrophosphate-binding protein [Francisella philomiragia]AJI47219.1 thiamine pyrophosphate enzyme, central domain protein [Francisella philomiragia]AJI49437.1 thiamine pyrophosphate enzyme, central domain protein [Francisella philomiragia]MBK2020924.1 alpha-keto acid decarboxylase family protein [Francisella philomiragia]MBK2029903.1 alpha-keto acid decarboxylase family protein [Francisella philomiragia]MBK2264360.1 alpha-keto acid decarboxylase family protein [Francisella philomira